MQDFAEQVLNWFDQYGRKDLPWQHPRQPYTTWLSEIMLQQTQVVTVIPYYEKFIQRFPDIITLANASSEEVMQYWAGLGYYARARNLHKTAQIIVDRYQGVFPDTLDAIMDLPGIGRSTAGAILSQAFDLRYPILDANIQRVLARFYKITTWPGATKTQAILWRYAQDLLPETRLADYSQAMMDLGATLCTKKKPSCLFCPIQSHCQAYQQGVQDSLPIPKPKLERKLKQVHMLMLYHPEQGIFLQQKPTSGIWGGLWSFPEIEADMLEDWLLQNLENNIIDQEYYSILKHDFTHFRLEITPVFIKVKQYTYHIADQSQAWYKLDHLPALPVPVKKLMQKYILKQS